jgi:hypothetical protein
MHLGHIGCGWRQAEIGRGRRLRHGAAQLPAHHGKRLAGLALLPRLADADDGDEAGSMRGFRLGAHLRVLLPMILTALRMADDHVRGAEVGEHFRRDVARVGARLLGVAILAADGHVGADRHVGKGRDQCGGWADEQVDLGPQPGRVALLDIPQHRGRALQPVHFPVAGNQRTRPINAHFALPSAARDLPEPAKRDNAGRAQSAFCDCLGLSRGPGFGYPPTSRHKVDRPCFGE